MASYTAGAQAACRHCRWRGHISQLLPFMWKPILVAVGTPGGRRIRPPTEREVELAESSKWKPTLDLGRIPEGTETRRLLQRGFHEWEQLYPRRQRHMLELLLASSIVASAGDQFVELALRFAVLSSVEFAGYMSRWDSRYLKPYEAVANHRYQPTTLVAEPHVWGYQGGGRGTVSARLAGLIRASEWNLRELPNRTVSVRRSRRTTPLTSDTTIVRGSAERIGVPDETFDLVLTDPPYHDDVQYGELSQLFRVWVGDHRARLSGDVTVGSNACSAGGYQTRLTMIFADVKRTLKQDGHLIFSYANRDPDAWTAVIGALHDAGFVAAGYTIVHSENETDHSKRGKRSNTLDMLIDVVPKKSRAKVFRPATGGGSAQTSFLHVMGRWVLRIGELEEGWESELRNEALATDYLAAPQQANAAQ
ncbi:MAG TPA: hypothetical protein ENH00_11320 [Actinobacteria bacterium]|nr:hypothetical protein [Actinomycetota bacterium]